MKLKIAICDDEPEQSGFISSIVKKWGAASGNVCEIKVFPSSEAFLFDYDGEKNCLLRRSNKRPSYISPPYS